MSAAICPSCEQVMRLSERLRIGQRVACRFCSERLVVIHLNPIELEWSDEEDWEQDLVLEQQATRVRNRPPDWSLNADWERNDGYGTTRARRGRKKRSRGRRDTRRRQRSGDDW